MEVVIVVDGVDLEVPKEPLGKLTGRPRRDNGVLPPMVEYHGRLERRCIPGAEIGMAEGGCEQDQPPDPGLVLAGKSAAMSPP
jgi:hypothetical protein